MTQLTINHLAPYLSHKMIVKIENGALSHDRVFQLDCGHDFGLHLSLGNVKPLLRPLTDLTKEINHRGETFVPIIELAKEFHLVSKYTVTSYRDVKDYTDYGIEVKCCVENDESRYSCFKIYGGEMILHNEYRIVQQLHEWHFDTQSLIESGLAIDVNTLDFNPYEK